MGTAPDPRTTVWRRSTYSNGDGGSCVEIADGFPGLVPVRDSKAPDGPVLAFGAARWAQFVEALRVGSL
ncbi:DUF397 domain-containing protein [Streptomyces sp. NPDC088746]|uniref:DUF397 domain-containing protein n=1 Tax=Streptomyces sp. NPDC088746 TaxID=3365885 RepID=UPI0037F578BE